MSFSLFRIPVRIQPMFWLVAVLLGAPGGTTPREIAELAIWIVVLFVSILAHELGHAFAMRAYGRSPSIELWGLGGLTSWGEGPAPTPGKDIVVSLAGPAAGLLLGGVVYLVARSISPAQGSLLAEGMRQALWINVFWGLANLAPIVPLDGGHVLTSCASWWGGERGRKIAYGISLLLAVAVVAWAASQRRWWIAFLGLWCASLSWRGWSAPVAPPASPIPEAIAQGITEMWQLMMSGRPDEAVRLAERVLGEIPEGDEHEPSRTLVLEALAWARIESGDEAGAIEAAGRIRGQASDVLRGRLAIAEGRVAEGLAELERALDRGQTEMPAMVLASVYIDQQRPDLVLALLRSKRGAKLSAETHLTLSAQLFHAAQYELTLEACQLGVERFNQPAFAYNAACSLAKLGRIDESIQWLERAVELGFADAAALDGDSDLAELRTDPRFAGVRSRVSA